MHAANLACPAQGLGVDKSPGCGVRELRATGAQRPPTQRPRSSRTCFRIAFSLGPDMCSDRGLLFRSVGVGTWRKGPRGRLSQT
eukprot:1244199-Rhodomonas_salina.1